MRGVHSAVDDIRRSVFTEVARLAYESDDYKQVDMIPYKIVPGEVAHHRHDVFLERAIVSARLKLALGMDLDPNGPSAPISANIQDAATDQKYFNEPLVNIIPYACNACPPKQIRITDSCQGCISHPCMAVCPKNAIYLDENKHCHIDQSKCIKCGKCFNQCPYRAISKIERPCAAACGMDAIESDELGRAKINYDGLSAEQAAQVEALLNIDEEAWVKGADGYYYYQEILAAGAEPIQLFTVLTIPNWGNEVKDLSFTVGITAEAVQSDYFTPDGDGVINGWGADYGDPVNFVGQEILHDDNAYYSWYYSNIAKVVEAGPADWQKDLVACYEEFTDLVNTAKAIVDDTDARYAAFAKAEASMLNSVLVCPCYFEVSWTLTHANEYSKINAMYGPCNYKAVNWETSEEPYTTAQYEEFAAAFDAATKA